MQKGSPLCCLQPPSQSAPCHAHTTCSSKAIAGRRSCGAAGCGADAASIPLPSAPPSKGLGVVWQQMSSGTLQEAGAGCLLQLVPGETEQDLCSGQGCHGTLASTNPGLARALHLRLPIACCGARAEDPHRLLAGCPAPASPPCPRKLALSQSVTSCLSPQTPALSAELI